MGFAEHVLTNAARLWAELGIDGKRELQEALFPDGLSFDEQGFGTAVTSFSFAELGAIQRAETSLASPRGMDTLWKGESRGVVKAA